MTTHRRTTSRRLLLALSLVALALSGCKHHSKHAAALFSSTDYPGHLQALTAAPSLPALRWPNFTDVQPQVQALYAAHDGDLLWITGDSPDAIAPTPQAHQLLQLFTNAAQKGLNPADYDAALWPARLDRLAHIRAAGDNSADAQRDVAQFDLALTIATLRYLADLHLGRINPQALNFDIDVPAKRAAFDLVKLVNDHLLTAADIPAAVAAIEPQNPIYKATEAALPAYIALAAQQDADPQPPLPALPTGTKPLVPGDHYTAADALLARLQLEGDAPASAPPAANTPAPPPSTLYTPALATAVKHFQLRHGIVVDGKLGQGTLDALNVPLDTRVRSLNDTLERLRWLPDNYQQPRVLVNLPEFQLRAYAPDHSLDFKMLVIDGEAKGFHDTPMFVRLMRYVVFRPYWNLPPSIIKKEIVPHIQKSGIAYLAAHGYEATTRNGTVVPSPTVSDIEHLRYAVRQKPGPQNSLGLVKFLFPNEYDVYMHSTPELYLFGLARRDKSHGCVRLQHADQMALWVLGGDQKDPDNQTLWDIDSIHDAMNDEDKNNKTLNLRTPLPVVLTYLTATGDEDGTTHLFTDIYGYDKDLDAALAKGRPYSQAPARINPTLVAGETE